MSALPIDGVALSRALRADIARRALRLAELGRKPGLAVLLVGADAASQVYVRNKVKACEDNGLHSLLEQHPASLSEAELLARIAALNADPSIDGILVQLPLPPQIDELKVIDAISPLKDVDGFHPVNAGALLVGRSGGFVPCTPAGCMRMLASIGCDPRGKHAVVVGRSNIVGKPVALLLLQASATVTICHSATPDLAEQTRRADILVSAVGKAELITAAMIKPGAVVIDVGMNRDAAGRLCGDVDYAAVSQVASAVSPVPGGVGPMTITMLLANTVEAAERSLAPSLSSW